ncbi:MAG TPA: glycosyltransferase [Burkholderiales bacterium]|nr:glycosyltransferase [Burkholderiales bacterium]
MSEPLSMDAPLVSICIPAYNGATTLGEALDSIVAQAFEGLEVVVCDDRSTDGTVALAEDYARRHPFIRVVRNEKNLGMDRNFTQSVLQARGTYAWMCGQDDVFYPGAFARFREILARHPDVDVIYFNYRFLSGDLSKEVLPPRVKLAEDAFFESGEAYFRAMDHAPTFLAATVMRRALWDATPYEKFFDTHYVQMGVVLYNLPSARTYVVADPRYVGCRVPEDSWKLGGGKMLFEIFSGSLEVYDTVYRIGGSCVPESLYRAKMREFVRKLPSYVANFGERGFRVTPLVEARLRRLYGRWPLLYWLYVWPVLHLPRGVYATLLKVRRAW